uniref:NADH-ubiquinone oxidoreductase chain 4L n=1 Tax=Tegillarca granosa TaxID=220873 RepID=A0A0A7CJD5_TEGGR|nr:NADH dehydrogenase subunit 4L [Tegillarca granosa]AID49109.1 NADH dehydrogenase subunit 4L [Tegillarca granosa]UAJ48188.1 NADH dehydrogenase subunit 4L [Tegillarca granosa]
MFFGGFMSMLGNKHVLSVMVSVEFLFLAAIWMASSTVGMCDMTPVLMLLVLGVCEAALMLSVLVRMVRSFGNDLVLSLGVLSC